MVASGPCAPYANANDLPDDAICGEIDANLLDLCLRRAAEALWEMLGNQFPGECSSTVRPIRTGGCWEDFTRLGPTTAGLVSEPIPLRAPVRSIESVTIDGEEIDDWYLVDNHLLYRSEGGWPSSQSLHLPSTDPNTFAITYTWGPDTPEIVVAANVEMALWLYESWSPKPGQIEADNVSRQGMSWSARQVAADLRRNGPTLPAVATAVGAYNPEGNRRPWGFFSPDDTWDLVEVFHPTGGS